MSGSLLNSAGRVAFRLAFEVSPIILTGGIAASIPGGMLPIVSITEAANFVAGLLSGGSDLTLDNFFAHFRPLPGSTLIDYEVGMYPFANQAVAANAIIAQPLRLNMLMVCPSKGSGSMAGKLLTFTALQKVLQQHAAAGGLYTVATPAALYEDLILTKLVDATQGESRQVQAAYVWEFIKPLVTNADAQAAAAQQNTAMGQATAGVPSTGATTSISNPGATSSLVPAATNLTGATAPGNLAAGAATPGFVFQPVTTPTVTSTPLT